MNKAIGFFMMTMGVLMIAMWSFSLLAGMVPELKIVPFTTAAHIAAEMLTGAIMVTAGLFVLLKKSNAGRLAMFALGMYIYAVIQAPGYYWQQGVYGFVAMFAVFFILGIITVIYLARATTI